MDKRLYSINAAAYIMAAANIMPEVLLDTESNTYYFVFQPCYAVSLALRQFRTGNPNIGIQDFLRNIKLLRETMAAKGGKIV